MFVLTILAIQGCGAKTEYVYMQPKCSVPPMVTEADLPDINVDLIYDKLGRKVAEKLRKRERLLVDSLLEHRAILKELCDNPESGQE